MTLLSAHTALFVVVRFSAAFAFAVAVAFAFALVAVFALALALAVVFAAAFAVPFSVAYALALAFVLAFALACVIHFHWICFSEVVRDPRLVRAQVGLDDRPQHIVVTLKLFRVHQQMVSLFCGTSRSTTLIFTSSSSFDDERKIFVDIHLVFPRLPRLLKLCQIVTHARL